MTIPDMLGQSILMTILGMGVVFGFLVILVGFIKLVEIVVKRTGLDNENANATSYAAPAATAGPGRTVAPASAAADTTKRNI